MAEYQGKSVKLNSPSAISKGEPGYGRKKSKVYVMDGGKVKKVMFGDPNMKIRKKITQKLEHHLEQDINAVLLKTRPHQDTGLAKHGKEKIW